MRQRKAKDLEKRLQECSRFLVEDPSPEVWEHAFDRQADLFLEIGCGKGNFIIKKALDNPENNYIAFEGQETVILRAVEKARAAAGEIPWPENVAGTDSLMPRTGESDLANLKFSLNFVEKMDELFGENSLAGLYLNFSDPWPKARHAKRRLTYHTRLEAYARAVKPGGFMEIKTDNDDLFQFTLEEIELCGFEIAEMTRDLHASEYQSKYTMTEYEEKFSGRGKNINYVRIRI